MDVVPSESALRQSGAAQPNQSLGSELLVFGRTSNYPGGLRGGVVSLDLLPRGQRKEPMHRTALCGHERIGKKVLTYFLVPNSFIFPSVRRGERERQFFRLLL